MRFKIFPYKRGSMSAKLLARNLGVLRVGHNYDARRRDIIINWGNSNAFNIPFNDNDLNKPSAISIAANKLKTFKTLSDQGFTALPDWTTDINVAKQWCLDGNQIYCRTKLTGHSGSGIVIATFPDEIVNAPLYTKAAKHKHEYRVHVFKGEALDVQQKKRRRDWAGPSTGIRNHSNGWVYCRTDVVPPPDLVTKCIDAVKLIGLDFAAVDIGYRERDNATILFEINTAPGLVGTTLTKYTEAFKNYLYGVNHGF